MTKKLFFVAVVFGLSTNTFASHEPQQIVPAKDARFLQQFPNLYTTGEPVADVFNIMIIGQDDGRAGKLPDGRAILASRSDIMMFLSINLKTHELSLLNLYRDHPPTEICERRMGRGAPDGKINGVYSIYGRQGFIPCIEGMMEEMVVNAGPRMSAAYLDRGRFKVHAFFEMTRSLTLKPMGKELGWIALKNTPTLYGLYGTDSFRLAYGVLSNLDQLFIELKERKAYLAHGYQRAFNNAWAISNVLGWAAFGIEGSKENNYDFMGKLFGDTINKFFSRSVDFKDLEKNILMKNGDHALRYACYRNNNSPIKIVLWDDDSRAFATYHDGKLSVSRQNTDLRHLKIVKFLPQPPNCK